jgi:DNA-3-methyladenine glycosylase II
VWDRLVAEIVEVTPQNLAAAEAPRLRACGLSGQKCAYLTDLAQRFASGALDPGCWSHLDDEALIAELVQVKGIGRWTAEMFLIFHMARPDVLPLDDIGLQRAMSLHYNSGRPLSKLKMRRIAKVWAPWRSVATWYLWRSLDPLPVEY